MLGTVWQVSEDDCKLAWKSQLPVPLQGGRQKKWQCRWSWAAAAQGERRGGVAFGPLYVFPSRKVFAKASSFNSIIEFDSNQLDADASTSCGESSYSYVRNVKKRKLEQPTPERDKVIRVLETMIAKQVTIMQRPEPTPLRSIVRYWDERLSEMSQEEAEAAEQEMTQV
ncbi:hypothetical protein ACLKA7_017689 [Drosophila subpalustris]